MMGTETYTPWQVQLARMNRPHITHCGGLNPRTGKRVGTYHRWDREGPGRICVWCHRTVERCYEIEAQHDAAIRAWADARGI